MLHVEHLTVVSFYHVWLNLKQSGVIKSVSNMGSMSYRVAFKNMVVTHFIDKMGIMPPLPHSSSSQYYATIIS